MKAAVGMWSEAEQAGEDVEGTEVWSPVAEFIDPVRELKPALK